MHIESCTDVIHSQVKSPNAAELARPGPRRFSCRSLRTPLGWFASGLVGILKNPVNLAMALGLVWRLAGIPLPSPAHQFLDLLGRAVAPLALFCLGATLPPVSRGVMTEEIWATILKLFVLPVLMVAVCYALDIRLAVCPWR